MADEYDDIVSGLKQESLRTSLFAGARSTPDAEAKLQALSERVGLPVDAIRRNQPEVELHDRLKSFDYEKVIKDSPQLSAWMADPKNAAVAHDDWENLSRTEKLLTHGRDYAGAVGQGVVGQGAGSLLSGAGELYGVAARSLGRGLGLVLPQSAMDVLNAPVLPWWLDPGQVLKRPGQTLKDAGNVMAPPKERQTLGTDVASGIGQLGFQIGSYILTGGASTTLQMFAQGADIMADKTAKDTADPAMRDTAIVAGGAITAVTEKYGLDKILNRVPPAIKNRALRFMADKLAAGGIEAAQEAAEGLLHDIARRVLTNREAPILEGVEREMSAAALSAAIVRTALGVKGFRTAQQTEQFIGALGDDAKASKLRERLPERYQALVEQYTANGPVQQVMVPAERFVEYFQSQGMDPAQAAATFGATNFAEAVAAGSDIVIPMGSFQANLAPTDHLQGLMPDLRLAPDEMTIREAKEAEAGRAETEQRLREEIAQINEAAKSDEQIDAAIRRVVTDVEGQLLARYDQQTARQMATVMRGLAVMATRANPDAPPLKAAEALWARYGLTIRANPLPNVLTQAPDFNAQIDPLLDRLRAGDVPTEAQAMGKSLYEFIRDAGGLKETGETRDMDENVERKPGQRKMVQADGMELDAALQLAVEAGYFASVGDPSQLTESDLLEALGDDMRGSRRYSPLNEDASAMTALRQLRALDEYIAELGGDLSTMDNAALKALIMPREEVEFDQSATIRAGKETLKKYGLAPGGRYKTRQVAAALEARQRAKYGTIPRDDRSPEAEAKISKWMVEEVLFEMRHPEKSGVGWYSEKFQRALDVFGEIFPELQTDQNARDLLTALIAITSDGQKVVPNFAQAIDTYANFRETGKFVTSRGHMRQDSITNNLAKIQELHDTLGPEGMREYLMQEETVSRLKKVAKENGIQFSTDYQANIKLPMAALVFGPKLGAFYANLMGAHGYLTMDRWWSRTFNRYRGTLLTAPTKEGLARFKDLVAVDKGLDAATISDDEALAFTVEYRDSYEAKGYKNGTEIEKAANTVYKAAFDNLEDQPFNATDRTFMLNAVKRAQKTLERRGAGMSIADIQAVLWYYEKRLYGELGAKQTADISYEEAARKVSDTYRTAGGDRSERLAALGDGETAGQTDAGVVPPGEEDFVEGDGPVEYDQSFDTDRRGSIQIAPDRKVRINLFEKANLSTFLHESGHFYLEVMGDLAEAEGTSQQVKDDYAKILKFLGVSSRTEIGVPQHEKWARANEAYLMEGKAPTPELRGVFQRFSAWLKLIYRQLSALNVELTDEVRGVMDRIYATDAEIARASQEAQIEHLLTDAKAAGMSEAEFALYREAVAEITVEAKDELQRKLMRIEKLKREAWWKDERAKVAEEVAAEFDAQPRAQAFKRLSKIDGGERLNRAQLVERYGEPVLKRLPRAAEKGSGAVYAEDGQDIDAMAEVMGFDSADAMMEALANMPNRARYIAAESDARMMERHGDLLNSVDLADAAMEALHNGQREKVLRMELRALNKQIQGEMVPADMLRGMARSIIGDKQVRDLSPHLYLVAERKAAREAFRQMAEGGDRMEAFRAKQRELLNHYLYLEATRAKQEADGIVKYLKGFEKDTARQRLAKAGADYLDQIEALLERYEFKRVTQREIGRRESLAAWLAQQEAAGNAVAVPLELQDEARRVNWQQVPMDELRALRDSVKNIAHLASLKGKLMRKRKAIDFDKVVAEMMMALDASGLGSTGDLGRTNMKAAGIGDKGAALWRKFDAAHLKVEQLVEWLDGGKIDGPWARYLFDLADDAQSMEYDLHAKVTQKIEALSSSMPKAWRQGLMDRTAVRLPGFDQPMTRYDLISIALNMGNAQNLQRLQDGYRWSDADLDAVRGALTAEDWRFVQGTWDAIETLWPYMAELEERTSGLPPEKVEAQEFEAAGQTWRGGYFPLVYDPRKSNAGEKQTNETESVQNFMAQGYGRAATNRGATKQRVEKLKAPVLLDYEQVVTSHLAKVIKDISHREAVIGINKILTEESIKAGLIDKVGAAQYEELRKWLQVLVNDRSDTLHQASGLGGLVMKARTNMAIVTMGWKISTMLAQVAGLGPSLDVVKPRFFGKALIQSSASPRETWAFIAEKSGEMRNRANTIERDARDALLRMRGEGGVLADVRRTAFYLTAMADRAVSTPTWLGAYQQALAEGKTEEDAIRAGDRAVRLSQGAGGSKDLAAVQRNNELMKLLTMYYTPFNVLYARLRDVGHQGALEGIGYLPKAAARLLALVVLPAVLGELLAARGPDEDEDETWWAIRKILLYPIATIPVVRDLSGYLEAGIIRASGEGEMKFPPSYKLSPVMSAIEKVAKLPGKIADAATGEREVGEVAWDALETSGYVLGLPTAQARITGEYLVDLLTGEAEPENAAQMLRDAVFRRQE